MSGDTFCAHRWVKHAVFAGMEPLLMVENTSMHRQIGCSMPVTDDHPLPYPRDKFDEVASALTLVNRVLYYDSPRD